MKRYHIGGRRPPLIKNSFFTSFVYLCCAVLIVTQPVQAGHVTGAEVINALMDSNAADAISFNSGTSSHVGFDVIDPILAGFPREGNSAVIISTGDTNSASLPNDSTSTTTELDGLNTADGQDQIRLEFVLVPPAGVTSFSVDWRLLTEEFPENLINAYNDTYSIEVGAQLIIYSVQSLVLSSSEASGTTYDGATFIHRTIIPFSAADLNMDGELTVTFSVFDVGDSTFDTAVLLDKFEWGNETGAVVDFEIPEPVVDYLTVTPDLVPLTDTTGNPSAIEVWADTSVAVSTISAVQLSVDGVPFIGIIADDGDFNGNSELAYYSGTLADLGITSPGVYTIQVRATSIQAGYEFEGAIESMNLVVYDPSAGFVSGAGWFDSPEGAYPDDPSKIGPARVAFVSKYQKGKSEPTGKAEFRFDMANLQFQSSVYHWLVIAGDRAKFKGTGVLALGGEEQICKFMLTGVDGESDEIRVRLWQEDALEYETVIYDNGDENGYGSPLEAGKIIVHDK